MNADAVATTIPTALSTSAVAISNLTRKVLDDTTSSSGKTEPLTPSEERAVSVRATQSGSQVLVNIVTN